MTLTRVTYTAEVDTLCFFTLTPDHSRVRVSIELKAAPPRAEAIASVVQRQNGRTASAEDLANRVATDVAALGYGPVTVVVTQLEGHGVEAEAVA